MFLWGKKFLWFSVNYVNWGLTCFVWGLRSFVKQAIFYMKILKRTFRLMGAYPLPDLHPAAKSRGIKACLAKFNIYMYIYCSVYFKMSSFWREFQKKCSEKEIVRSNCSYYWFWIETWLNEKWTSLLPPPLLFPFLFSSLSFCCYFWQVDAERAYHQHALVLLEKLYAEVCYYLHLLFTLNLKVFAACVFPEYRLPKEWHNILNIFFFFVSMKLMYCWS